MRHSGKGPVPLLLTSKLKPALAGFMLLGACMCLTLDALAADTFRPMRFDHLNADDGLSQNSVISIAQDQTGFMWFATENGLNRYDGVSFKVFRRDRSNGAAFNNDFVTSLAVDNKGSVWVGTDGGGLVRWDSRSQSFTDFRNEPGKDNSLPGNHVSALLHAQDGTIWIGTLRAGLARLNPANGMITRYSHEPLNEMSLTSGAVKAIYQDETGRIWVGTDAGLNLMSDQGTSFRRFEHKPDDAHSLSDNRVRTITQDDSGELWVGTRGGLNRLNMRTGQFVRFLNDKADDASLSHNRVRAVFEDSAGRLWVGTAAGLNLYDSDTESFTRYVADTSVPGSLADDNVLAIFEDRSGVLWVGTGAGGVSKWNPRSWSFGHFNAIINGAQRLSSSNISSFAQDDSGRLWIGTFGGGLNLLDRSDGSVTTFKHQRDNLQTIGGDRVMALLYDSGSLWVGTMTAGLTRLNTETGEVSIYRHDPDDVASLGANGIMSLFKDAGGNIWVGTFGGGVSLYDRTENAFVRFGHDPRLPDSLSSPRATSFAQGPGGKVWVGTDGGGLNLLDPETGKVLRFQHDQNSASSISANTVYSLFTDRAGDLWIGTRAGLDHLRVSTLASGSPQITHISQADGLANDVIYGIQPDNEGRLWISTNYGLSRIDPATLAIRNFHRGHGLQGEEFNFGAHYRGRDGELFFGGANGFNAFKPEELRTNQVPPPLALVSISKFNAPLDTSEPYEFMSALALDHRDSVIGFEVAALDYTAPEQNRYAYKLEGFDEGWVSLGNVNRITYTNLDAGNYTLRVKAANSDGVWNESGIALSLVKRAAPWATGWAYLAYLLVAFSVAYYFWRDYQRKREMEKDYMLRLEVEVHERTQQLAERNEDLERVNKKLEEASLTDPLTGLRNRRFLFEEVSKDVELMRRDYLDDDPPSSGRRVEDRAGKRSPGQDMAFMMLDLDHFKPINDRCGHVAGDRILVQVRDALTKVCRNSDFIIRWGGDEFLIVGRHANRDEIEAMAERIRSQIAQTVFALGDGQVARTTCSIGYACYPFIRSQPDLLSWQQILGLADSAMYDAKASRNAWTGYMSTPSSSEVDNVFKAVREAPAELADQGQLEIRRGTAPGAASCASA